MSGDASPRAALLARVAEARLRDPLRAGPRVLAQLREELSIPVEALLGLSGALAAETPAAGDGWTRSAVQRIHEAGRLLPPLVADVLDLSRVATGKFPSEWEAVSARLGAYLRPAVAAVLAHVELLAEDPAAAAQARLLDELGQVAQAGRYVVELVNDLVLLLELLGAGDEPAEAPDDVREVVERFRSAGGAGRVATANRGRVLVVDDSQVNRDLLVRLLGRLGYAVETADGGLPGLAMARGGGFDLMLLDIIMPEVDGFQVLHQLKADAALRSLPVIVISALDEGESVSRCLEMGAEDYLAKPFDPLILKTRIGAALEKRRLSAEPA
ncbi:MAG TPA: response regulator [Longimicrobiaceae bacterium]|nr:response regulator [Longimicrobiaceae bacterium]